MKHNQDSGLDWPCAKFVEYTRFVKDEWLRDDLIRETGSKEAFAERAEEAFRQQVIAPTLRAEGTAGKTFLLELRRMGYDDGTIARALAAAWYDHANHFTLPRIERDASGFKRRLTLSVSISAAILTACAYAIYNINHKYAINMLIGAPILAGLGVALIVVIYKLTGYFINKH